MKRKVSTIRIALFLCISVILFAILALTIWQEKKSISNWNPDLFELSLFALSVLILAIGVSYLSGALKKETNASEIATGILAVLVFINVLFPLKQDANNLTSILMLIVLTVSAVLVGTTLFIELYRKIHIPRYSFIFFPFISAVYGACMGSLIFKKHLVWSESGYGVLVYGVLLFFICLIELLLVIWSLKLEKGEQ